ncbi:MAG TPA: hypothetical protein VK666_17160, partial [Chryseolinea sp.]|nr:hypothetical protein [Chryseolinea sp.]
MTTLITVVKFLGNLFKSIWIFFAPFVCVVAMFILLISVEQGIDVVIHAGEFPERGILAVGAIILWAYLLWYSSRTLSYVRQDKDDRQYLENYKLYTIPTAFHQHVPRFLAYNCFVCVQVAIFNLPTIKAWNLWMVLLAITLHGCFYVLLHAYFFATDRKGKVTLGIISISIIIGYGGFLIFDAFSTGSRLHMRVFENEPYRHQFWLRIILIVLFTLQTCIIIFFIRRRQWIDAFLAEKANDVTYFKSDRQGDDRITLRTWFQHPRFSLAEKKYFKIFNAISAVAGALYLGVVFNVWFSTYI